MATGSNTRYSQEMGDALSKDSRALEQMTRQRYGMSPAELGATMEVLMGLSRGQAPVAGSPEHRFVHAAAKARYNMSPRETDSLLRDITKMPQHQRLEAYLTGGGRSEADPSVVQTATRLTSQFAHQDMESSLGERLEKRVSANTQWERFTHLKPDSRALEDVKNRQDLRNNLRQAMGADTSKPTIHEMRERVVTARNQLADKIDARTDVMAATGATPNLKESLSESFDLHYLDGASRDLGMGSPIAEANHHISESMSHMSEDFDVTESLRSNNE